MLNFLPLAKGRFMVNKKEKKSLIKLLNPDASVISLRDIPLDVRRKEAGKPLFLTRYD